MAKTQRLIYGTNKLGTAGGYRPGSGRKPIHGMSGTPEYRAWVSMKYRCQNKNCKQYKDYGGRGIKVCDRWQDFMHFLNDMGNRPGQNYSIDRKNNNGSYSPENCRWATSSEQNRNQRAQKRSKSRVPGVVWKKSCNKWRVIIYFNKKNIHVGYFVNLMEALTGMKYGVVRLTW